MATKNRCSKCKQELPDKCPCCGRPMPYSVGLAVVDGCIAGVFTTKSGIFAEFISDQLYDPVQVKVTSSNFNAIERSLKHGGVMSAVLEPLEYSGTRTRISPGEVSTRKQPPSRVTAFRRFQLQVDYHSNEDTPIYRSE